MAFVRSDGNDGTAEVGNEGKPYLTAQPAFDLGATKFDFGVGNFGTLYASGSLFLQGRGIANTFLNVVNRGADGANGGAGGAGSDGGPGEQGGTGGSGEPGSNGGDSEADLFLYSNHTISLSVEVRGGNGGSGGGGGTGGNGGDDGMGTPVNGGAGGDGSTGGNGGTLSGTPPIFTDCYIFNLYVGGGLGGGAGGGGGGGLGVNTGIDGPSGNSGSDGSPGASATGMGIARFCTIINLNSSIDATGGAILNSNGTLPAVVGCIVDGAFIS
jgi:hypothetical protein